MGEVKKDNVDSVFTYHPPSDDKTRAAYEAVREGAKAFAKVILEHTPRSKDQEAAIRQLRLCVYTANSAI
jgi:hypothetical protein